MTLKNLSIKKIPSLTDDDIIVLHHHDATVGIEFEPVTDEEQRKIQSGIRQIRERRDRMIRRNSPIIRLTRRIRNREGYGKVVFTGILIGRV